MERQGAGSWGDVGGTSQLHPGQTSCWRAGEQAGTGPGRRPVRGSRSRGSVGQRPLCLCTGHLWTGLGRAQRPWPPLNAIRCFPSRSPLQPPSYGPVLSPMNKVHAGVSKLPSVNQLVGQPAPHSSTAGPNLGPMGESLRQWRPRWAGEARDWVWLGSLWPRWWEGAGRILPSGPGGNRVYSQSQEGRGGVARSMRLAAPHRLSAPSLAEPQCPHERTAPGAPASLVPRVR